MRAAHVPREVLAVGGQGDEVLDAGPLERAARAVQEDVRQPRAVLHQAPAAVELYDDIADGAQEGLHGRELFARVQPEDPEADGGREDVVEPGDQHDLEGGGDPDVGEVLAGHDRLERQTGSHERYPDRVDPGVDVQYADQHDSGVDPGYEDRLTPILRHHSENEDDDREHAAGVGRVDGPDREDAGEEPEQRESGGRDGVGGRLHGGHLLHVSPQGDAQQPQRR
mmetsp:Transcript_83136/g.248049  ORF Transcript_83136/g.248049 Transcript_83136/m.248049 type:complete len:225 (-) Transcript_83136:343-1017(-)